MPNETWQPLGPGFDGFCYDDEQIQHPRKNVWEGHPSFTQYPHISRSLLVKKDLNGSKSKVEYGVDMFTGVPQRKRELMTFKGREFPRCTFFHKKVTHSLQVVEGKRSQGLSYIVCPLYNNKKIAVVTYRYSSPYICELNVDTSDILPKSQQKNSMSFSISHDTALDSSSILLIEGFRYGSQIVTLSGALPYVESRGSEVRIAHEGQVVEVSVFEEVLRITMSTQFGRKLLSVPLFLSSSEVDIVASHIDQVRFPISYFDWDVVLSGDNAY